MYKPYRADTLRQFHLCQLWSRLCGKSIVASLCCSSYRMLLLCCHWIYRSTQRTHINYAELLLLCCLHNSRCNAPKRNQHAANNATGNEARRCNSYTVIVTVTVTVSNKAKRPQTVTPTPTATSTRSHSQRGSAQRTKPACLTCVSQ